MVLVAHIKGNSMSVLNRLPSEQAIYYRTFTSPLFAQTQCQIVLVGSEIGLHILHLDTGEGKKADFEIDSRWQQDQNRFTDVVQQLEEYFLGKRQTFDLVTPLQPLGTQFQQQVWQALTQIPFGKTCRYMDIAQQIDRPKAVRAVGAANGRNPIPIIVPCHRVVGSDGSLTGFAHGVAMKQALLTLEGR